METKWIDNISKISGVTAVLMVDHDGLIVTQAGTASQWVAPHSALLVKKLIEQVGINKMGEWHWTQCETEDIVVSIANVDVGILVLVMRPDANLGLVRIEARNIRNAIQKTFTKPFSPESQ
ncbi:MAG: hypothetical protein P9M15_04840 [Candidatus Electryoneaceae bacterium]|nr:hypothetical protein [Candidatus Electryoneaceae bacterium]